MESISRFNRYNRYGLRGSVCAAKECECVVKDGLSYSPSDISRLTERGMPVNSLNTGKVFFDGEKNPTFNVSSDRQRFVDVCDLWEDHVILRDKARKAAKAKKSK